MENFINNLSSYINNSVLLAFLAAYLGGILVSFTPCTYPMVPVTIGIIGVQDSLSKMRGFLLSLFYVLGISLTYAALGGAAALSGTLFGQMQTTPWTYFIMANLCLIMGLSMFDIFNINLPVPRKLVNPDRGGNKKGFLKSFMLGAASGIVMTPCTAPVLAVLLGYVALRTNILLGMSLLFVFAFGMGTLMILVGTFTGVLASLPKSGDWMVKIKFISGLILIGAAEYFLFIAGKLSI